MVEQQAEYSVDTIDFQLHCGVPFACLEKRLFTKTKKQHIGVYKDLTILLSEGCFIMIMVG